MKLSEQWLRTWVDPQVDRDSLVAQLSMSGLEVDAVQAVAGDFTGVVVGEVLSVQPHPDADKLRVCTVSDGRETLQVVCGAPNVRAGLKVPFAVIGATLPGNFKIKKAKLRGIESQGMLCSAKELMISEDHGGLMELAPDAPVGADFRQYLMLDDATIEIGLTPNRGDCLSVTGIARDVAAIYGVRWNRIEIPTIPAMHDETRPVELLAPQACPRYLGRVIRHVDLRRPTPVWMVERLRRSDIRSIDPAVDVTNYVMLELGQPMHAFDLKEIRGGIRIRMAEAGEKLVLLDGQTVELRPDTLVIADHQRPLAIAGVMGGEHSGIAENTSDLFLEAAFFSPLAIANKARSYGLHTESSHRYERGVDSDLACLAMERATQLLLDIVGGEPGPIIEQISAADLPRVEPIVLRGARVAHMLGVQIASSEIERMLIDLGLGVQTMEEGKWSVTIPSHRFDLTIEEDLIEEVARLYGYDRLPVRYPQARLEPDNTRETQLPLMRIRRLLVDRGYQEAITYSFIDPDLYALFDSARAPLMLSNPISTDLAAMRSTLWPGLLKALQHNLNRQQTRIRLFESGLRFIGDLDDLQQQPMLAGAICGARMPEGWANDKEAVDFFDIKADVEAILASAGAASEYRFLPDQHQALHPGQTARIERNGQWVGYIGALHPQLAKRLDIDRPVYLFELALSAIEQGRLPAFQELSRFPEVRRDLALLVDRSVAAESILETFRQSAGEYLTDLRIFDVYQGKGIDPDRKSLAVGLTWQHPSRTLNDDEVNDILQSVIALLEEQFNATLRK